MVDTLILDIKQAMSSTLTNGKITQGTSTLFV